MPSSRRTVLAAGATGLSSLATGALGATKGPAIDRTVAGLVERSEKANAALMRGDVETYLSLIKLSDDFTLMSPFGGTPSRAPHLRETWEQIGKFFKNGTLRQELVHSYGSADIIVLVIIEHGHGEVGGLPAQDWPLRVTLVYRREGDEWQLAHRHADPLARGITLEQSSALARGEEAEDAAQ